MLEPSNHALTQQGGSNVFIIIIIVLAPLSKTGSTKHSKEKKATRFLKTFFICIAVVGILGIAIALAMCMFQPGKR